MLQLIENINNRNKHTVNEREKHSYIGYRRSGREHGTFNMANSLIGMNLSKQ